MERIIFIESGSRNQLERLAYLADMLRSNFPLTLPRYGMTYAVIARCPRSGQFGIGIASYPIAVGRYCDGALRANTGATLTQGVPNSRNNPDFDYRQFGIIDRENDVVAQDFVAQS
jgi:hypothetical protein